MSRIVLDHGGMRMEIEPRVGAGIANLSWRSPGGSMKPLMRPAPAEVTWFNDLACYALAPWSNRVAGASFDWRGQRHALHADWSDGTAIHGLVKDRLWKLAQRSPVSALLTCDVPRGPYPWSFAAEVEYRLGENSLRAVLVIRNQDVRVEPMPAGLGFHPFWRRSLDEREDQVVVRVPGLLRYPCEGMIPVAKAREDEVTRALDAGTGLGGLELDDVFAGSSDGAEITWVRSGVRVRYRCSSELGHTVVFTGMPGSFCLEPVSMVNDGFNLESRAWDGTGVRSLAPGEAMRAEWMMEVDTI